MNKRTNNERQKHSPHVGQITAEGNMAHCLDEAYLQRKRDIELTVGVTEEDIDMHSTTRVMTQRRWSQTSYFSSKI
jgi:hypothetical protein